jgi:hypothetical protein
MAGISIQFSDKQINTKQYFLLIVLLYILFSIITNQYIITEEHYFRTFSEQLSANQIHNILNIREKWSWIGYALSPLIILLKIALVAMVLKIGAIISNINVAYKHFFRIAILAETVFVLAMFVKIIWLYFHSSGVGLEYIQYFYPLSAINLVNYKAIAAWSIYAIQILNLFELAYWFVLAFLLKELLNRSFWSSFEFVLSTYGLGLLFWVIFVVFISLNFS